MLAQDYLYRSSEISGGLVAVFVLVWLGAMVFFLAVSWRIYTKAGQPGWASIVPFYNFYVMLKIVGRPGWWLLLAFIPFVNFIIALIVAIELARVFGKGGGFAVGLIFLPFIFYPILAFGDAAYTPPAAV